MQYPTACATRSPQHLQGPRAPDPGDRGRRRAAASAPRAGSTSSTAWCCGRRASSAGRCKWACERREAIPADEHARDNVSEAELALDADGRFLALRVRRRSPTSAPTSRPTATCSPPSATSSRSSASTRSPAAHVSVLRVLTNTNSTAPYRGAGRPGGDLRHRAADRRRGPRAGRSIRVELRRKNLIPASAMPYKSAARRHLRLRRVREEHGRGAASSPTSRASPARREASRARGRLRGLGGGQRDRAGGRARSPSSPRSASRRAAAPPSSWAPRTRGRATRPRSSRSCTSGSASIRKDVRYIDGDTDRVGFGMGTMGSRSTVIGGTALWMAADKVIAKGQKIAARAAGGGRGGHRLRRRQVRRGGHRPGGRARRRSRARPSSRAQLPPGVEPGLYETGTFSPKQDTWPNGCHVCEVEVDPGHRRRRPSRATWSSTTSAPSSIPLTLKGQIHGGVAQGVGQALMEQVVYEPDSGQLLTASFMEYAMPRADTLLRHGHREQPGARPSSTRSAPRARARRARSARCPRSSTR